MQAVVKLVLLKARTSQVGYNCSGGSVFKKNLAFLTNELWQVLCHSPRVQSHRAAEDLGSSCASRARHPAELLCWGVESCPPQTVPIHRLQHTCSLTDTQGMHQCQPIKSSDASLNHSNP